MACTEALSAELFHLLSKRGLTLAFAESLTGGNLAAQLVKRPGVSACFLGSLVCYAETAKQDLLGVRPQTLKDHGAVSPQTAEEMVRGLYQKIPASVSAAVTGLAGPDGDLKNPVGTVYAAFLVEGKLYQRHWLFPGSRRRVIRACTQAVYSSLIQIINIK
jgi:PncC family amidohydrolase